jgi:beta-glucosidase
MSTEPFWGVTCSSLQTEGVAPAADWSAWEADGRAPRSGDGNGLATNAPDDFALLGSLGISHIRLGIEWARIEPLPGKVDGTAVDQYRDLLAAAGRAGLAVIATLHHQTLPGWFADDEGGYRDVGATERRWARHVDRCAEAFDDLVAMWVPIDDPIGWAVRGFGLGSRPPGRTDPVAALAAAEAALLANHRAWQLLRGGNQPVMAVFGVPTVFAHGPEAGGERWRWRHLLVDSWIGALRDGELALPDRPPRIVEDMAGSFDLIGVTHDHPIAVDRTGAVHPYPATGRRSDTGFTPVPAELGELLAELASLLPGRRLVVAGHGVATTDDEWREELLKSAVATVTDATRAGLAVAGYLHDTGIDGYEGPLGFRTARGVIGRDRTIRPSGEWWRAHLRRQASD